MDLFANLVFCACAVIWLVVLPMTGFLYLAGLLP